MDIDKREVLRYLRYDTEFIDPSINRIIENCINEVVEYANPNFTYKVFNIIRNKDNLELKDTVIILEGKDIYSHLKNSEKCVVMAATLGTELDRRISYYSRFDMTMCMIMDACATAAIESVCDELENQIQEIAEKQGYHITGRYSPGYGDLNINLQPKILNTLNSHIQIGLTVTDSLILVPRKSVTALIGFTNQELELKKSKCKECLNNKKCLFREEEFCES